MKTLYDTSVLVAALVSSHNRHSAALSWLQKASRREFSCLIACHSLAEVYSILTRLPVRPPISGSLAWSQIRTQILPLFEVIPLDSADYQTVISSISASGLIGGITYDALIAQAAAKSGAERILTLNPKDFLRAYPGLTVEIVVP